MSRGERGRFRLAFLVSVVIHAAVVGFLWVSASRAEPLPQLRVFAVDIVSPPPRAEGDWTPEQPAADDATEPEPEPAAEPDPEPTPPQPEPARQTPPTPAPTPPRTEPSPAARPTTPAEQPRQTPPAQPRETPPAQRETPTAARPAPPSTGQRPDPTSPGGEDLNVRIEGARFVDPEYLANIQRAINRYFRRPGRRPVGRRGGPVLHQPRWVGRRDRAGPAHGKLRLPLGRHGGGGAGRASTAPSGRCRAPTRRIDSWSRSTSGRRAERPTWHRHLCPTPCVNFHSRHPPPSLRFSWRLPLSAQEGVRLGLVYQAEYQPGLVVLPFASAGGTERLATPIQTIIRQDLDFCDRFEIRSGATGLTPGAAGEPGALEGARSRLGAGRRAHRRAGRWLRTSGWCCTTRSTGRCEAGPAFAIPPQGDAGFRMAVHAAADEVVRWATGEPGSAASRIAFVLQGRGGARRSTWWIRTARTCSA